jgi:hypothetical protein
MMKFTVKSLIALCITSLTLLLTSTKSDATVNMKLLTYSSFPLNEVRMNL